MKNAETWRLLEDKVGKALIKEPTATRIRFRKNEQVYEQGELSRHLYVVLSGRIRVSMVRADGYEFLLEIMGPGALMGEGPALDGAPRFAAAVATEDSELLRFAVGDLPGAIERNPELAPAILSVTAAKQRNLANRLLALTMASPKSRIAEMLFRLSGSYGVQQGGHLVIETRLSHEQIAALVGVTRVTVTRAMQELTSAGILKVEGNCIQILDTQKLHEFSIF
jgi:CRP-like cAMP-binding protein